MDKVLFNTIITLVSIHLTSAVSRNQELISMDVNLPRLMQTVLSLGDTSKSYRATVSQLRPDSNDMALSLGSLDSDSSDDARNERQRRTSPDISILRLNIVGVDGVAAALQSLLEKIEQDSRRQEYLSTLYNILRRSVSRPNVELGPGAVKSELYEFPENYFENRLKILLKKEKKRLKQG